ncbi:MAG: cupin domain-containing protein [Opitutales bacterium]
MKTISRETAEHYQWGGNCDGWHLVRGGPLSVIEENMPPGATETAHHHGTARQFFYVLRGRLGMELAEGVLSIQAGEGLEVPPGVRHRAHNSSGAAVEFLVCSSPPAQGDRITGTVGAGAP